MKNLLNILFLACLVIPTEAQRLFSEGVITYNVYTDGNTDQSLGKYVVYLKGSFVKRHLLLNNGLENTTIYNGEEGTSATLKIVQGIPYALMLNKNEVESANKKFAGATYDFKKNNVKIAGYNAIRGTVSYPDGKTAEISVTYDLRPEDAKFLTMFPNLNGIPLNYKIDNGRSSMRFIADKVEIRNVGSEEFIIPKNYKIVTKKELEVQD